ncbi:uncharacterized protein V6R79_008574 [Siganus canaliculatus]
MFVVVWTTLLLAVKAHDASIDEIATTTDVQDTEDLRSEMSSGQYAAKDLQQDQDPHPSNTTTPGTSLTEAQTPVESSSPSETEVLTIPRPTPPATPHVTAEPTTKDVIITKQPNKIQTRNPKDFHQILNESGCTNPPGILSCVCISEGSPLPVITWPQLQQNANYSVTTTVSKPRVNSTIVLSMKDQRQIQVQCNSENKNGNMTKTLLVTKTAPEDQLTAWVGIVTKLEIIISFSTGVVLAAVICCSVIICRRRKRQTCKNMETLEMTTCGRDKLMNAGSAVPSGRGRAAMAQHQDVEYSSLDFSQIKRGPTGLRDAERDTKTLYAEIKKVKRAGR